LSFARRTREFFVTNDEKYQTCLIFGLHVTNDENAVNVARTRGNFVDPTCHSCAAGFMNNFPRTSDHSVNPCHGNHVTITPYQYKNTDI
jgi:hypothetical protein